MSKTAPFAHWRPHPWHGLGPGAHAPTVVTAFIEITPFDLIKYEIDKASGFLRVDRPQRTSSLPPALYGFIPQTLAGERVGQLMAGADSGDGDPLDICVLSERPIDRAEVLLDARVIGGIPMLDDGEADDKIIAVLRNDDVWGHVKEIDDIPVALTQRLLHYFSTYKLIPGRESNVRVGEIYGRLHAEAVINAALDDYADRFPAAAEDA